MTYSGDKQQQQQNAAYFTNDNLKQETYQICSKKIFPPKKRGGKS